MRWMLKGEPCKEAWDDASLVAWDKWSPQAEDCDYEEEPDYYIEVYDPEKHDRRRAGGGSFEGDFIRLGA